VQTLSHSSLIEETDVKAPGFAIAIAALGAAMAGPAFAQQPPQQFYFGIGGGSVHLDDRSVAIQSQFDTGAGTVTSFSFAPIGGSDTALTAHFGVRMHRNLAAEIGYSDLGKYSFGTTGANAAVQGNTKLTSFNLALVGILPLDQVDLYARAGYARSEFKSSGSDTGLSIDGKERVSGFTGGVGARWNFMQNVGVFAEYQGYSKVKANAFLAGVDFRF
jgi:opacity protein-like surface antigen